MGAVHGVSLKYAGLSVAAGITLVALPSSRPAAELGESQELLAAATVTQSIGLAAFVLLRLGLWHTFIVNGVIFILFRLEVGMLLLGKDVGRGSIPLWSYLLFPGFHVPTWLYTSIHRLKDRSAKIAVADEVAPGWWVGGRYAAELGRHWSGIIDLTCEFPEGCAASADGYMLVPCWDGIPPPAEWLERAANFGVTARSHGEVIVHCAHGRGRSTTVMCACLVKAGLYKNWEQAFEAIKRKRKVVKLNGRMKAALTTWQHLYMELSDYGLPPAPPPADPWANWMTAFSKLEQSALVKAARQAVDIFMTTPVVRRLAGLVQQQGKEL